MSRTFSVRYLKTAPARFVYMGAANTLATFLLYQILVSFFRPDLAYSITWLAGLGVVAAFYPSLVFGRQAVGFQDRIAICCVYAASFLVGLAITNSASAWSSRPIIVLVIAATSAMNFLGMRMILAPERPDPCDESVTSSGHFETAACVALSSCMTNAILFVLARRGLSSHLPQIAVSVLALVSFLGAMRFAYSPRMLSTQLAVFYKMPLIAVSFFVLVIFANWYPAAVLVVLALICMHFFWRFRISLGRDGLVLVTTGAIAGFSLFLWTNAFGYPSVWAVETALSGAAGKDTLYHADLAVMIQKFSTVTTGLSGLVPITYYPGSHAVIGGIGHIAGVLPLEQYAEAQQIFLLPCFLFSLVFAATTLLRLTPVNAATSLVAIVFVTAIFDWCSFVASESYCLSLVLMFLCLPQILGCTALSRPPSGSTISFSSAWLLFLFIAIALVKTSVAIIFGCLCLFSFAYVMVKHVKFMLLFTYVGVPVVALAVVCATALLTSYSFKIFEFPRDWPQQFWGDVIVVALGLLALSRCPFPTQSQRRGATLAFASTAAISLIPGLIVDIGGGSSYYFQHPVALVACLPIAGWFGRRTMRLGRAPASSVFATQSVALIVMLAALLSGMRPPSMSVSKFIAQSELMHNGRFDPADYYWPEYPEFNYRWILYSNRIFVRFDEAASSNIYTTYLANILIKIEALKPLPPRTLVYIPPEAMTFWSSSHADCTARPFVVPALAGLPMILGLPPSTTKCDISAYGFEKYNASDRSRSLDEGDLCREVLKKGFSAVVTIADPPIYASAPKICSSVDPGRR